MTQKERILDYMERFGSISTMEAFTDLGITRLSARIFEIRNDGIEISEQLERSKNRYGENVHYMRYSLKERS